MPTPPTLTDVKAYLGPEASWTDAELQDALDTETVAQAHHVFFPAEEEGDPKPYPADLAEALCRRVQRNLSMRQLPLGYQTVNLEFGPISTRIGSDPEVHRLENPWRQIPVA